MLNAEIINTPVSCDVTEFLLLDQSAPGLPGLINFTHVLVLRVRLSSEEKV